jgi:uncharacterized protein
MDANEILKKFKVVAVVGCSRDPKKPAHYVPAYLKAHGYTIIPVNPYADVILDEKCYKSLLDINDDIDIVEVFRPGEEALEITKQALEKGAKVVWLQEGITNDEAKAYAEKHNIVFVENRCMMKEHQKMKS